MSISPLAVRFVGATRPTSVLRLWLGEAALRFVGRLAS